MNAHECSLLLSGGHEQPWAECSLLLVSIHEHSWAWWHITSSTHVHSYCHGTILMSVPECSCVLLSAHESSGVLLSAHDCSWYLRRAYEFSWELMSTHECSWVLMSSQECSWVLMSDPECSSAWSSNQKCQLFKRVSWSILTISWSRFNQIIKSRIFLKSTLKGLLKNSQMKFLEP